MRETASATWVSFTAQSEAEPEAAVQAPWLCTALVMEVLREARAEGVRAPPLTAASGTPPMLATRESVVGAGVGVGVVPPAKGQFW